MPLIKSTVRKATVEHVCDFCGCKIAKGEKYEFQTYVFDGLPYTWMEHLHCQSLCEKLWDYADPDEPGMTSSDFIDAVREAMATFYCPYHCQHYDVDLHGCRIDFDEDFCIRQFARFMKDKHLCLTQSENGILCWQLRTEANHA